MSEKMAYERLVREKKLRAALSRAKKENDFVLKKVGQVGVGVCGCVFVFVCVCVCVRARLCGCVCVWVGGWRVNDQVNESVVALSVVCRCCVRPCVSSACAGGEVVEDEEGDVKMKR